MPEIKVLQLLNGASTARGLTVIIDVFRAFTTACWMIEKGAEFIIPFADINVATEYKKRNPDYLFFGERKGIKIQGADYGNSPSEVSTMDLTKRKIIFSTSAGTQGFSRALEASELISGSFCNAAAIVAYIKQKSPDQVSLVCMGHRNERPSDEDTLCAEYIKSALMGSAFTQDYIRSKLSESRDAAKFFNPQLKWAPENDFYLCTQLNIHNFILKYDVKNELPFLTPFGVEIREG